MQISAISNQSFGCVECNSQRIAELQQKQQKIQWATEGCNGSLNSVDQRELDIRTEYEGLLAKSRTVGLNEADLARFKDLEISIKGATWISRDSLYPKAEQGFYI